MKIVLASISTHRGASGTGRFGELTMEYLKRASRYMECEHRVFSSEGKLLEFLGRPGGTKRMSLYAADSRGDLVSSEELAASIRGLQESGTQVLVVGVGPHDGFSADALGRAAKRLALGRITLPHELARLVLAEQIYRALTILAGHPYHGGH